MAAFRESYLLRIACDPPMRAWSGIGDLPVPADAIDLSGATYTGVGEVLGLPNVRQLINGVAERLEFQLSGVDAETLRLVKEDAPSVKGATCRIGSVLFDEDWQLVGGVEWEWLGRADVITINSQPNGRGGRQRSIALSVGSYDTGRSRAGLTFFTDAEQRRRSSDDAFFSHIAGMSAGVSRRFGPV